MQIEAKTVESAQRRRLLGIETESGFQMKQENLSENISFIGGGFRMTLPKCMLCSNFNENSEEMTCKAFPEGIPDEKLWADEDDVCNGKYRYEEEQLPPVEMTGGIFVLIFRRNSNEK